MHGFFVVSCMAAQKIWWKSIVWQGMREAKTMRPTNHWVITKNKRKIICVTIAKEDIGHSG